MKPSDAPPPSADFAVADCFISYKHGDESRVEAIVQGLRATGLATWWDRDIAGGARWREVATGKLRAARCVVACWTKAAVASVDGFMLDEADHAKGRRILLPLRLDRVDPPLGFGGVHTLDLVDWDGDVKDPRWLHVVASVKAITHGNAPPPHPPRPLRRRMALGGIALAMATALGVIVDLAGLQSALCRLDTLRGICRSLHWGHVPSVEEEQIWNAARTTRQCSAYRDYLGRYAAGAYAGEAQALLAGLRREGRENWTPRPQAVPLVVPKALDGHPDQEAARAAVSSHVKEQADLLCGGYAHSDAFRHLGSRIRQTGWQCSALSGRWRCGFDGTIDCELEERTTVTVEVCQ